MNDKITNITDGTFDEVVKTELPVLVDFWATWCGPCRMLAPTIDDIAEKYDGQLTVVKADVDECEELTRLIHIRSVPTLIIFKDGQEIDRIVGNLSKAELCEKIDAVLAS